MSKIDLSQFSMLDLFRVEAETQAQVLTSGLLALERDHTLADQLEAVSYYRKALYLEPNHGEAQIHLALLMEKQGDTAGAQVLRNRARRLAQQSKTSHE